LLTIEFEKLKRISESFWWALAFLLVALAYMFGLFVDITGDSGLYAAISRQMVESGDWFNLKLNGAAYDQKPHLFFWLSGLGIQLFGNSNFAYKLFPFLYGLAGFYFTYRLAKQVFSEKAGKFAAMIAGTSQIYFLYFFDFHTDSVLQTGVMLALWQLAAYLQTQKPKHFILGFIGIGLAMLSKGPVGAVLPFLLVLVYLVFQKDFRQLFHPKWLIGIFIVLITISPSILYLYKSFGFGGLKFFFITNNVGRITGSYVGSSTDHIFYFHTILWAFLPWTFFVVASLFSSVKSWFTKTNSSAWSAALLGSVFILTCILSIAKGKAPNYFLIAVTPISVIAGNWLAGFGNLTEKIQHIFFRIQWVFVAVYTLFFVFVVWFFGNQNLWFSGLSAMILFLVGGLLLKSQLCQIQKILLVSVIITSIFNIYQNTKILPELAAYQGGRQVLKIYEANEKPESRLYNFELDDYNLFFYSKQMVENVETWEELYEAMAKPGCWIYTNEIKYNDIISMDYAIDTVYQIKQRGMNDLIIGFLNPETREKSLKTNYLMVIKGKNTE